MIFKKYQTPWQEVKRESLESFLRSQEISNDSPVVSIDTVAGDYGINAQITLSTGEAIFIGLAKDCGYIPAGVTLDISQCLIITLSRVASMCYKLLYVGIL